MSDDRTSNAAKRVAKAGRGDAGVPDRSSGDSISQFLEVARATNPKEAGRLIFALDATMSRQPTWDRACAIQGSMFEAVARTGGLSVQLVYFRGFGECRASRWVMNANALRDLMTAIECRGGQTQIGKVLTHAAREAGRAKTAALVYIGDAMEEDADRLCRLAGELGLKGTKMFVFQEGEDASTERTFREFARLTAGAWFRLGPNSAGRLAELLGAVAVYAQGGRSALEAHGGEGSRLLLRQLPPAKGGG